MNKQFVLNLMARGESETIEFKTSFDQAAIESIVAFANTKGGYVIIGITDAPGSLIALMASSISMRSSSMPTIAAISFPSNSN